MEALSQTLEVPSRRFGRYLVRSRLGAGGMAEVFLSEVVDGTGRSHQVALKLLRKEVPFDSFADEADLMGLLQHPNLVQKLEFGEAFGRPFIAMELLHGGDLRELLRILRRDGKEVPPKLAVHVTMEVLKALAYFHQAKTRTGRALGLIHGDVNPSNIFFSGYGEVKLGDYGVAKSRDGDIGPQNGMSAGKLRYMSPEALTSGELTPASDLFGVGILLYELLVGYHPFDRGEFDDNKVVEFMRAPKLTGFPDRVDERLQMILTRALKPDAEERFQTAGEFAAPLFQYALDTDQWMTAGTVRDFLAEALAPKK